MKKLLLLFILFILMSTHLFSQSNDVYVGPDKGGVFDIETNDRGGKFIGTVKKLKGNQYRFDGEKNFTAIDKVGDRLEFKDVFKERIEKTLNIDTDKHNIFVISTDKNRNNGDFIFFPKPQYWFMSFSSSEDLIKYKHKQASKDKSTNNSRFETIDLELKDNIYYLNGIPFTGIGYELYESSGDLKCEFELKNGKRNGLNTSYYENTSFQKTQYLDTLALQCLNNDSIKTKEWMIQYKKDSTLSFKQAEADYNLLVNNKSDQLHSLNWVIFINADPNYNPSGHFFDPNRYIFTEENESKYLLNFVRITKKYYTENLDDVNKERFESFYQHIKTFQITSYVHLPFGRKTIKTISEKIQNEKNKPIYKHKISETYIYLNGVKSGIHKEYDKNDKLVLEDEYKGGVRNGSFKRYDNEVIKEVGTYVDDKKNSVWTLYSYNGKEEITYSNDKKEGEYKKFSGDVVIEEGQYSNGLKAGNWKDYNNQSVLTKDYIFIDDKLDGPYKEYSGDVVVKEGQYSNGLMTGEWIFRYDSGNLRGQGKYVDGDGGNLSKSGFPINGRSGEWIFYYENGNKKSVNSYSNGTRDFEGNIGLDYNEDGSSNGKFEYKNGKWKKYLSPEEKEKQRKEAIENRIKEFNSPTQVLDFLTGYVFINYDDNIAVIFTDGDYEDTRFIVVYDPEEGDVFGDVKYPGSFTDLNSLEKAKKMNWGTIYREDIETRGSYAKIDFNDQILYVNVNGKLEGLDKETYGHGKVLMRMDYSW
ncbi:hypothetical protein OAV26_00275 [Crocinitomicaceae bacterium]|nr:hypothetical protein [Crocinitomicaceae bacterium]